MKRYLLYVVMVAVALAFVACGSKEKESKTLILYYSQTGTTELVAHELQKMLNADVEVVVLENPYVGPYEEIVKQVAQERENGNLPLLAPLKADLSNYDVIYLGYPIWFGTYATPIASLVREYDFEGKTIIPFCTFGSGGLEASVRDLRTELPQAVVAETGFGIRTARISVVAKELYRFMVENNYIDGSVEALPGYSEMLPVSDEEKRIFDAACGDYQFPLGTPVFVGKRGTSEGVDYVYEVENNGAFSTIYVTVANTPDAKPEFTRVVR